MIATASSTRKTRPDFSERIIVRPSGPLPPAAVDAIAELLLAAAEKSLAARALEAAAN